MDPHVPEHPEEITEVIPDERLAGQKEFPPKDPVLKGDIGGVGMDPCGRQTEQESARETETQGRIAGGGQEGGGNGDRFEHDRQQEPERGGAPTRAREVADREQ